jgi:hypothetical protein
MSDTPNERRFLSRGKVAKIFDVTTRTVRRWELEEKLEFPPISMILGRGYFDADEIEAFQRRLVRSVAARGTFRGNIAGGHEPSVAKAAAADTAKAA